MNVDHLMDSLPKQLLLVQLLACAATELVAAYETVEADVTIHGLISQVVDVMNECECRAKCQMDASCTGASYDAVADLCSMTDGGPYTIVTRPLLDSVSFFKFQYSEPAVVVFLSDQTTSGDLASQREWCAKQNGIPLIIRTETVKADAIKLVKDRGTYFVFHGKRFAWLSARDCNEASSCRWPDGIKVTDGVFTEEEINNSGSSDKSLLAGDGTIGPPAEPIPAEMPILCMKVN